MTSTTGQPPTTGPYDAIKTRAREGVEQYLREMFEQGKIAKGYYDDAMRNVMRFFEAWIDDPAVDRLSPRAKEGLVAAVKEERWVDLVNAFARKAAFGTGGIRALMAYDRESIVRLKEEGIDAPILKGENTINNLVLMRAAHGIADWLADNHQAPDGVPKAVVGCDSRTQGMALREAIARVFLSRGIHVYLFDEPVPYPEVTFGIPAVGADIGVFISASHNDYRYNGFKLSGASGAQISIDQRNEIINRIEATSFADIHPVPLPEAGDRLHFLGGEAPQPDQEYYGRPIRAVHAEYTEQLKRFVVMPELLGPDRAAGELRIVFSAFNGAGRTTVPRILGSLGFRRVYPIPSLFHLDGLFPAFKSAPGEEQQPDPGDPRAAVIALGELEKAASRGEPDYLPWKDADILIGTDPDADRCGVIAKPPPVLASLLSDHPSPRYGPEHVLIPADDMWALLIWYRLAMTTQIANREQKFIALSHTTSDCITLLAQKFGLGVVKTWVGFAWLSTAVRAAWAGEVPAGIQEGRPSPDQAKCHLVFCDTTGLRPEHRINVAALEQSNGFSMLGGPAPDRRSLGVDGHVLDKDGTLAALLVAEIAAYAKREGTNLLSLLTQRIYADPDIGLFANYYEPDPLDGEYPGLEGDTKKKGILERAKQLYRDAGQGGVTIGGRAVHRAQMFWTGKYDKVNGPEFPDEGLRFYFGDDLNHVTIRPSGTTNSLRFHVQLRGGAVNDERAGWQRRLALEAEAKGIVDDVRDRLGAERQAGVAY